jgi:flagellar hook-basal body complex protein FliE
VTDDSQAFINALNSSNSCIYVPPGVYLVSETIEIPTNKKLSGCPRGSTVRSTADTVFITNSTSVLEDITINHNGANKSTSIGVEMRGFFGKLTKVYPSFGSFVPAIGVKIIGNATNSNHTIIDSIIYGEVRAMVMDGTTEPVRQCRIIANLLVNRGTDPTFPVLELINARNNLLLGNTFQKFSTGNNGITVDADSLYNSFISNNFSGVFTNQINDLSGKINRITTNTSNTMIVDTEHYLSDGVKVVGQRGEAVADVPTGGSADAADNAAAINAILSRLRSSTGHGLIADS